ncbi:MAG: hypothetical protein ACWGQW_03760 [bacterium]
MNVRRIFEELPEVQHITDEQRELLNRLMNLDNPVNFDENFASDEELDALEDALDLTEREVPHHIILKTAIFNAPAKMAEGADDFI